MKSLAKTYGLSYKHEPASIPKDVSNKVIKIRLACTHQRDSYEFPKGYYVEKDDEWWVNLSKRFDHTIILDRKPTLEHLQSIYYLLYINGSRDTYCDQYAEWTWDMKEGDINVGKLWEHLLHNNTVVRKRLNHVAELLNKEIVYYDKLYLE